ncbi:GntR family transcriptional regulator [Salibacterium aidingense]|uniref:GntR family transcriptional regulator n=1 Tax=Salibacterium aidingense TaxID=384933 RepID=UPI003BD42CDD
MTDQVFDILKNKIINVEIAPGEKIDFEKLQNDLGISKTPLKEALQKLEFEGFVYIKPRSGSYVLKPNKNKLIQIYDLREAVEWKAIQLAINNISKDELNNLQKAVHEADMEIEEGRFDQFFETDVELHKLICNQSANEYIIRTKEMIDSHVHWYRILGATSKSRAYKSSKRHKEILDAVIAQDTQLASELMSIHIQEVKEATLEDIDEYYLS